MPAATIVQTLQTAMSLHQTGRLAEAEALYRQMLAVQPNHADALNLLGLIAKDTGRIQEAERLIREAIAVSPVTAAFHNNLGTVLKNQGRLGEAVASHRQALAIKPDYGIAHNNLGNALRDMGSPNEAIMAYRRAIELDADDALAHSNLGNVLSDIGEFEGAICAYRRALSIRSDFANALHGLAVGLTYGGRIDEALASFRKAMQVEPGSSNFYSDFLIALHYHPQTTLGELSEAHCEFDRLYAARWRAGWLPHNNSPEPNRTLRIGFVSHHFARHPVGRFLIRLLENLDPVECHVFCYSDSRAADSMTGRIRAAVPCWIDVSAMTDEQMTQRIREDGIDILFDLAGHTPGNRLLVFARKPAPIQIAWLDHVGTTGLFAMDYILADATQIPPGAEPWYREKILRMPNDYVCFDPPDSAPAIAPLPVLAAGYITFACFNVLAKMNGRVIKAWSRILTRVPKSRLMLKTIGFDEPATRARVVALFASHGIAAERILMFGWSSPDEALACYNQVDIALDTFPFNGGLTTCEALWMGVPVITLPGETFASRQGLTHLTIVGLPQLIAETPDQYVELAVILADDLTQLSAMRAGLREKVAISPLCDGERFAAHFSVLMREVWRLWISGQISA